MTLLLAQISGGSNNYVLNCSVGSYVVTGKDTSSIHNRKLDTTNGSYVVTGKDAVIIKSRKLVSDFGSYSLIGNNANLKVSRILVVDTGNYTIAGQDATFASSTVIPPKRFGVAYWVDPKKPVIEEEDKEEEIDLEYFNESKILDKLRLTKEEHNKIVEFKKQRNIKLRKDQDELIISMYLKQRKIKMRKDEDELIISMYIKGIR
jgi:hypothetical protein